MAGDTSKLPTGEKIRTWLYNGPLPRTIAIAYHSLLGAFLIAWFVLAITDNQTNTLDINLVNDTWATLAIPIYVLMLYLYLRGLHRYDTDPGHWRETEKELLKKLEPAMKKALTERIASGEIKNMTDLRRELQP